MRNVSIGCIQCASAVMVLAMALIWPAHAAREGTVSGFVVTGDSTTYVLVAPTTSSAAAIGDSSDAYRLDWSLGELAVGGGTSPAYRLITGFWSSCGCQCHADPQCDGSPDVLDVVQTISIAFRGAPAIPDPYAECPFETADVDCSGDTNILDVVKMVNVAFRGVNPATEFCNPCP